MMRALQRLFTNGRAKPSVSDEVETAVIEVLREADDLCRLLRKRRERSAAQALPKPITATE